MQNFKPSTDSLLLPSQSSKLKQKTYNSSVQVVVVEELLNSGPGPNEFDEDLTNDIDEGAPTDHQSIRATRH